MIGLQDCEVGPAHGFERTQCHLHELSLTTLKFILLRRETWPIAAVTCFLVASYLSGWTGTFMLVRVGIWNVRVEHNRLRESL